MRTSLLIMLTCLLSFNFCNAQDIITKRTGEDIEAKVFEITPTAIKYKRYDNLGGPTYSVLRADIVMIKYQNGAKEIYDEAPKASLSAEAQEAKLATPQELYSMGRSDALQNYDGYKGAGTGTLITSLIMPLAGLVPAIACSATTPQERNLGYHNTELMANPDYRNGYTRQARKVKSRKVWTNWGIGLGVNVFLVLVSM